MIVDTAVHYVEPATADRPHDPEGSGASVLLVEDAIADAKRVGIDRIVQMGPSQLGWDNRYNLEAAVRYPESVLGVFGRLDPIQPNVAERLREFVAQPGMLGVRVLFRSAKPSGRWLKDRLLDPLLTAAQEQNVAVAMYPADPAELLETARRFRGVRFIAEHMTLSPAKNTADPYARWPDVLALAAEPNVWTQVSFLPEAAPLTERPPFPTSQGHFKELYESAGSARMIWGAHYPRIKDMCTYQDALDTIRTAARSLPAGEVDGILGDNFMSTFARK